MGLATKPAQWSTEQPIIPLVDEAISSSISQTWTDQAIKCYVSKADCANCVIPRGNYSFTCQMYKVVPVLLQNLGEPEADRVEKILPFLYD